MTDRYLQLWTLFWYFNQFCELLVTTNLCKIALKVDVFADDIKPMLQYS